MDIYSVNSFPHSTAQSEMIDMWCMYQTQKKRSALKPPAKTDLGLETPAWKAFLQWQLLKGCFFPLAG